MNDKAVRLRYLEHRLRIQNAKSRVDSQAPVSKKTQEKKESSYTLSELMNMVLQHGQELAVARKNVAKINSPSRFSCKNRSKRTHHKERTLLSFEMNLGIFKDTTDSNYSNGSQLTDEDDNRKCAVPGVPAHVLQRYSYLPFVDNSMMRRLLRPRIFMDIRMKNNRLLGRLVIQLYTEACPEVVFHFVRVCMNQTYSRFNFTRLYPSLWLEGDLTLDADVSSSTVASLEHDLTSINHGSGCGILSFPSRYLRTNQYRFVSFTLSFKPANVLNGKRVAFGYVKRGRHVLEALQSMNVSRNDRPAKDITVSDCGLL